MTDATPPILRDLGDNLVLRRSCAADAEKLAEFDARIHGEDEQDAQRVAEWVKDLLRGNHPTFGENDFTIIENKLTGAIVSSLNLIDQTWTYDGIPFKVGRPELVGTDPEYRNRGLVRIQMETIHQWSLERGQMALGITGIPYYYRLFGYEMAMDLQGGRMGFPAHVPQLKEDQAEAYVFRPAENSDAPFISRLYESQNRRSLVACCRDIDQWKYEISGMHEKNVNRVVFKIIETIDHQPVGYLGHPPFLWNGQLFPALHFEILPGCSWIEISKSAIRFLWTTGSEIAKAAGKSLNGFGFMMGAEHPVYQAIDERLPRSRRPYAWYLRVNDLQAFLKLITPALENHLADSAAAGYTGEMKISFYRSGVKLGFDKGHLALIEPWQPTPKEGGDAAFPGLTFLQLLFGYRSLEELEYAFADCWARTDFDTVLKALFPKQHSRVFPIS